jgi:CRISPR-associated endonuclease/helicase Cas3
VLLLDVGMGGYDTELGFVGAAGKTRVEPIVDPAAAAAPTAGNDADSDATTSDDRQSFDHARAVPLECHLKDVAAAARDMAQAVGLPVGDAAALIRAGAWHDLGKAYVPFQALLGCTPDGPLLAKSMQKRAQQDPAKQKGLREYFRHELASALAFLQQHDGEANADLVAFLIAAHHGKVRMGLRALPKEKRTDPTLRVARGVQDGDPLFELRCGDEISAEVTLDLGLMEMGEDDRGRPSWSARTQALLTEHGPFRLAYLEALVRMADWRASSVGQNGSGDDA